MPEVIQLDLTKNESAEYLRILINQNPLNCYEAHHPFLINTNSEEEKHLMLSHTLLKIDKPLLIENSLSYHYFSVIEQDFFGTGANGSVRLVLGSWKINSQEAIYKVKTRPEKQRLLKSVFFSETKELCFEESKKKAIQKLRQEQYISSFIPHLKACYPITETKDGVHFLQRRQPGYTLELIIQWIKKNPEGLTLIQRLLLCIDLYEALETQVHTIKIKTKPKEFEQIIHNDAKPENVMVANEGLLLSCKFIDFGLSKYVNHVSKVAYGSALYMDPELWQEGTPARETQDLFGTAIMCAQICGDTHRAKIKSMEELVLENQNITFKNLFSDLPQCHLEQKNAINTILHQSTRPLSSQRASKKEQIQAYKTQLISAYRNLKTNKAGLEKRLKSLQNHLQHYDYFSSTMLKNLNQEFIAADFLIHYSEPLDPNLFYTQDSLVDIWTKQRQLHTEQIINTSVPSDTPSKILYTIKKIQKGCFWPFLPNSTILSTLVYNWAATVRLTYLFHDLKFVDQNSFTLLYDEAFRQEALPLAIEKPLKSRIFNNLKEIFEGIPPNYQRRFFTLCEQALNIKFSHTSAFQKELYFAINLKNLNIFYPKVCIDKERQLMFFLDAEQSFQHTFKNMYASYQKELLSYWQTELKPYIQNSLVKELFSSPESNEFSCRTLINNLLRNLAYLFEQHQNGPIISLPQKIVSLVERFQELNPPQNTALANTLQKILTEFKEQHTLIFSPSEPQEENIITNYTH